MRASTAPEGLHREWRGRAHTRRSLADFFVGAVNRNLRDPFFSHFCSDLVEVAALRAPVRALQRDMSEPF